MSYSIAIWGSPHSGKTSLAVKLARNISKTQKKKVIVVLCDNVTPSVPVIFPNYKPVEIHSVGSSLSKVTVTAEDVFKNAVTVEDCPDMLFLGFASGENINAYPEFDEKKCSELYLVLQRMADLVIYDCMSDLLHSPMSSLAVKTANKVVRLYSPDAKSVSFFDSQLPMFSSPSFRTDGHIQVINTPDADLYMPVDDIKAHLKHVSFVFPFFRIIKEQMLDGKLYEPVTGNDFDRTVTKFTETLFSSEEGNETGDDDNDR